MKAEALHLEELIERLAQHEPAVAAKVREIGWAKFAEAMQRGFTLFAECFERARNTLCAIGGKLAAIPGIEAWIAKLDAVRRYAPNQRKKKPRGWRAKERSRVAWQLFHATVAASEEHRAREAQRSAAPFPPDPIWNPEQPSFGADETPGAV